MEGKEFRQKREKLGLTQTKLAEILGVKNNTVARWESGRLPISELVKLAMQAVELKTLPFKRREILWSNNYVSIKNQTG